MLVQTVAPQVGSLSHLSGRGGYRPPLQQQSSGLRVFCSDGAAVQVEALQAEFFERLLDDLPIPRFDVPRPFPVSVSSVQNLITK